MLCDAQEKRIRAKHSINQLQKQVKQQQLQVSTRVKKQVASVRNLPRVRTPVIAKAPACVLSCNRSPWAAAPSTNS